MQPQRQFTLGLTRSTGIACKVVVNVQSEYAHPYRASVGTVLAPQGSKQTALGAQQ